MQLQSYQLFTSKQDAFLYEVELSSYFTFRHWFLSPNIDALLFKIIDRDLEEAVPLRPINVMTK